MFKTFLTIAGSDCIGGAGIQADIKTATEIGLYSASAITAITVQNSRGLKKCVPTDEYLLRAQIDAVLNDFIPDAVKIGMLCNRSQVEVLADILETLPGEVSIVLDPVMAPTLGSGFLFDESDTIDSLISRLLPVATVITPNQKEWDRVIDSYISRQEQEDKSLICRESLSPGILARKLKLQNLLITGGGTQDSCDTLYASATGYQPSTFKSPYINTPNHHGTGCVFSSAIASYLALGNDLHRAVVKAKEFVNSGLENGKNLKFGHGYGPANFFIK